MGGKGQQRNRIRTPVLNARGGGKRRQEGGDRNQYQQQQNTNSSSSSSRAEFNGNKRQRNDNEEEEEGEAIEAVDEEKMEAILRGDGEEEMEASAGSKEGRKVIIVLEEACLETVKSKSGKFELLNCDDHLSLHAKLGRDPKHSRPDIAHQCLLTLLDSPLNKAGHLTVYLKSAAGVLIEVSPQVRIPRTFKRFAGLMVQLLHDMRIRAAQGSKTLLRVIKNPVEIHLPVNARKFGTSHQGTLVDAYEFVNHLPDEPVVFAFGAMAQGKLQPSYVESYLSFSQYPLSGSYALGRLLGAFEKKWGVV